jgi:sterol desaturase/sphingolipid hydroxylase (fatty acid hydroxylase superfamily)
MIVFVIIALPIVTFVALAVAERTLPVVAAPARATGADTTINLCGFAVQGAVVPAASYFLSADVLPQLLPGARGVLGLDFAGAFALCFVGVDLLYYWQHRAFHRPGVWWRLHRCHHAAPVVCVWSTARNSLVTNFLFVYLLVNPWLAYLSGSIEGFMLAASVTASLDLWRHSRLAPRRYWSALEWVFVTPRLHHQHHDAADPAGHNFGANLSIWDRLFGTLRAAHGYPASYAVADAPRAWSQLVHPLA